MKENYNFNEIPEELKSRFQWVMWRFEDRNGKATKVPYIDYGVMAQSNNTAWKTFEGAVYLSQEGNFDGIGFMFSKEDDYIGIDIDHCVENGKPNEFAQSVIDALDSYTEFSPSGEGIHIIVKGSLPDKISGTGRKSAKHGLEIYRYGRYFTFTGNRENSNDIYERSDELEEIIDQYFDDSDLKGKADLSLYGEDKIKVPNEILWDRMFKSAKGRDIQELYSGKLINNDHSSSDLALCNYLAFWTGNSATRMDSMFRESALIRDKWDRIHFGDTGETYGERTIAMAISSTTSTVLDNASDKEEFMFTIHTDTPREVQKNFILSDLGNAERISAEYGHVIRYVKGATWYVWDGKRWCEGEEDKVERITSKCLRRLFESEDEDERKWAMKCEARSRRLNAIGDLKALVPAVRDDFDKHKYLLNVENGVVNLKDGTFKNHDKELMLTKITNVSYNKDSSCPQWIGFLESIFKNQEGETDYELIEYVQKMIGYALTADISEQSMFFLYGGGRNGKSVFINTIKHLLGDYAKQTNSNTFIAKKNDNGGANSDIARLVSSRFVSAIESEDGQKLSESLVKQITGGEPMTARFMYQDLFEFIPEFKVFFTTNHRPIVKGVDNGIWRRIKLIPFSVTIKSEDVDKHLSDKLSTEMSGILNWAIEGCTKWQREGLEEPESIKGATHDYKDDMDKVQPFIIDSCFLNENAKIEARELYNAYVHWCLDEGEEKLTNRAFYRMLTNKGLTKDRGTGNKMYMFGIGLNEQNYKYLPIGIVTENVVQSEQDKGKKLSNAKVTSFSDKDKQFKLDDY